MNFRDGPGACGEKNRASGRADESLDGVINVVNHRDLIRDGFEIWFAYVLALVFLLFRPQGLFGEKIIDRV